jgi:hypothetical protein
MTTLFVLDYLFVADNNPQEKEFEDKAAIYAWLLSHLEEDFGYITLFHGDNEPVDGWSDVIEFCRPAKTPDVCPAVCNHGRGLNCPECWPTSKTACIALRATELNLPVVDVGESDLPRVERFGDLPDGTLFYLAQTYAYGGRQKYQKTLEDGGAHNAVYANDTNLAMTVPDMQLVFRA